MQRCANLVDLVKSFQTSIRSLFKRVLTRENRRRYSQVSTPRHARNESSRVCRYQLFVQTSIDLRKSAPTQPDSFLAVSASIQPGTEPIQPGTSPPKFADSFQPRQFSFTLMFHYRSYSSADSRGPSRKKQDEIWGSEQPETSTTMPQIHYVPVPTPAPCAWNGPERSQMLRFF